jgi:hypothetical protein
MNIGSSTILGWYGAHLPAAGPETPVTG